MQNRPKLNRRQWLKRTACAVAACGVGAGVYAHWIEPFWVDFVEYELPLANLPPQWHGRTLVQISDIHVGHRVSSEFLIDTFKRIGELAPDVVAFTGDLISLSPEGLPPFEQLNRVLEHLPHGKQATLGVLGNHDYGRGWSDPKVAARLVELSHHCGMSILRNEAATLDGLDVIGVDDLVAGQCDGASALASSRSAARLVLCHNPDAADEDCWSDYQGWILAGHTHGGQCKPPFFAPPVLPVQNPRYTAGEIDLFDGRTMYINRGLGHLQRVRFNVRPEITLHRLTTV
jgi:predicted MPP superfamily phosphohydrolase